VQQENDDIRPKFDEDKEQIQKEKDEFLTEQIGIRESMNRALRSVLVLAQMEEEKYESQVGNLTKAINNFKQNYQR
jgi:hypothetical protein